MKQTNQNPFSKIVALEAPTYCNTTPVLALAGVNMTLWEIVKAALSGRLNLGLPGGAGMGKSQLLADVQGLFGNNASYVLGRNDLDIKELYRELNFEQLEEAKRTGGRVSKKDLTSITAEIHRSLTVVEEITRCAEIVQNQLFNIFEGFIEINGKKYALGDGKLETFHDLDGKEWTQNVLYSVGVWSANFGNGQYTGTVSMDKAMKERSHLIIDVDNFTPQPRDLDTILYQSGGEIRIKDQENSTDNTQLFANAFAYLKQKSYAPDQAKMGDEALLFRYLVFGLDYLPCAVADNSKRKMKEVWPSKAEEENIGASEQEITLYRMVYPSSVRGALTIMALARALREYVAAKNPQATPSVVDSVVESTKLVGAYSGMIENPQRVREGFIGNPYEAATKVAEIMRNELQGKRDLMDAIQHFKAEGKPFPATVERECTGAYACWK